MIDIPAALQARLDAGATTLAWAWVLTRRDGAVLGFTDHDEPLIVQGTVCEPDSGLTGGDMRTEGSFAPSRGAVFGVLNSHRIAEADLDNGIYDGARMAVFRVDWSDPALLYQAFLGEVGAVKRSRAGFEAELSGLSARLDRLIGRVFARSCDAELGDARCGVELGAGLTEAVTVTALVSRSAVQVSGVSARASGWFTAGVCRWTSGASSGAASRITVHRVIGQDALIELDPAPGVAPAPGDTALLTAGCDRQFATCRDKFSNTANYRGCPHMPGNDVLARPVSAETIRDGRSRQSLNV